MTRDEANHILHTMQSAYPHAEITEEMIDLWAAAFATSSSTLVLEAAGQWTLTQTYWPTIAGLRQYMRQINAGHRLNAPRGSRCDGSGWIENTDRASSPCPQCNPALFAVFSQPAKLRAYRQGVPLSELSEDVMVLAGHQQYVGDWPVGCRITYMDDPDDPYIHPRDGRGVAAAAYANDCEVHGIEPNWEHFDSIVSPE